MKIEDFQERLKKHVLVADGAMGSLLYEVVGPAAVGRRTEFYRRRGRVPRASGLSRCRRTIIETNTFGANRNKLTSRYGLASRVAELILAVSRSRAKLAKRRATKCSSPASIGPLGIRQQVERSAHRSNAADFSRAGCLARRARGGSLHPGNLQRSGRSVPSADAIRSFSQLPVIAQLTYSEEGLTLGGTRPRDAWAALRDKNIQAIGANCTVGPQSLLPILQELAEATRSGRGAERHAQRGIPQASRRSHRLSEIIAGIFRVVRA